MVSGKVAENIRVCREPCNCLWNMITIFRWIYNHYLGRHVGIVDDPPDVGHEAHVQHPVGLVQHEVLHRVEPDLLLLHKVQQSANGFLHIYVNLENSLRNCLNIYIIVFSF